MANPKKNQMWNCTFPMVDKSNFNAIESAITQSSFRLSGTVKYFRVTHGNSTLARSGVCSKTLKLVASGIVQITVKGTETSTADEVKLRITHPSCAMQVIGQTIDDNYLSAVNSGVNQLQSRVPSSVGTVSDMVSKVWAASRAAAIRSDTSHIRASDSGAGGALSGSQATELNKLNSRIPKMAATASALTLVRSDTSHIRANDSGAGGALSGSQATELNKVYSRIPKMAATASRLTSVGTVLNGVSSLDSNVHSLVYETLDALKGKQVFNKSTGYFDISGVTKRWSHVVSSDVNSVVRTAGT